MVGPMESPQAGPSVFFTSPIHEKTFIPFPSLLYSLHIPFSGAPDDSELIIQPETTAVYAKLVQTLHICFRLFFERQAPMRVILTWAALMMPPETLVHLTERRPRALIVFAHFTALDKWCHYQSASWWNGHMIEHAELIRTMLPNDAWREYMDATFSRTTESNYLDGESSYYTPLSASGLTG